MDTLLPSSTSTDIRTQNPPVAVLPVGSFEQHGEFHPLTTDTVISCAIAKRITDDYDLLLLPPVTFSCSQEHAKYPGTVSIKATTLATVVDDIVESLSQSGIQRVAIINGHGGNYVLSNVVQQSNTKHARLTLFPGSMEWATARQESGMKTSVHEDMHAGEFETSILLHVAPALLRDGYHTADHRADERPHLLITGMSEYSTSGVIGFPSLGTAEKGERALTSLSKSFKAHLEHLTKQN